MIEKKKLATTSHNRQSLHKQQLSTHKISRRLLSLNRPTSSLPELKNGAVVQTSVLKTPVPRSFSHRLSPLKEES